MVDGQDGTKQALSAQNLIKNVLDIYLRSCDASI
jgi:hypothetical protein